MSEILLATGVIAAIVLILGIIVTLVVWKKKKEGKYVEPDYRVFFILGINIGTFFI